MQNLTLIVDEKIANNRVHRDAMFEAIASGEVIAFIGAGLSAPLKYPAWTSLINILQIRANQIAPFNPSDAAKLDTLQYAEEINNHFKANGAGPEFNNILGREFGPRKAGPNCTQTHHRLVKLPFRTFVTTNYDGCLEQALTDNAVENTRIPNPDSGIIIKANGADRHRASLFLRSIVDSIDNQHRYVGYLHGRHDDTENIILTASTYNDAYGFTISESQLTKGRQITFHRQLAWSLFATRKIIFFGCSMDDPYVRRLLEMVAGDLWEWDQPTHFVVLPIDDKSLASIDSLSKQFQRFGLQPVLFNNCGNDFSNLDRLLDEAIERCPPNKKVASHSELTQKRTSPITKQSIVPANNLFRKVAVAFTKTLR